MKTKFKFAILCSAIIGMLAACEKNNITVILPSTSQSNSISLISGSSNSNSNSSSNSNSNKTSTSTSISVKPSTSNSSTASSGTIEGKWQYFLQEDSSASKEFMRTPYIEGITPSVGDDYYQSAFGKTGDSLKNALSAITNTSGVKQNYNWSRFEKVDEDPNNSNNIFCVYSRSSYPKSAHVSGNAANRWNREHTYPQSKISGNAKSDSIHIFADDWKTNGTRGNYQFSEVAHNSSTAVKDSGNRITANYKSGSYFEPCDAAKGEVARATLYVYVMYGHSVTGNFSSLDLCLKWNREFPVTTWEILRNNRNYSEQHNRNPFIDHPEFADLMFNK